MKHSPRKGQQSSARDWPRTLVTGATSGIGLAVTQQLAEQGVPVLALGRNREALLPLQARCPQVVFIRADLRELSSLDALVADLTRQYPDLACLINNAGIQHDRVLEDPLCSPATIEEEVLINLTAPIILTRAMLPHLLSQPMACVVNVTSALAYVPKRTAAVYSATKAGLHLFTQALRVQMQGRPLQVVEAVMPLVDTPMTRGRGRDKLSANEAAAQLLQGLRAGRENIWIGKAKGVPWLQRFAPGVLSRIVQAG
jgi:uncharacterized oxidoreductase